MTSSPRHLSGILSAIALLASPDTSAVTKVRDGFATMVVTDGTSLIPRNPVSRARGGDDVYYWIQWQEPVPRSTLRCVIKGPDTNIDETENYAEAEGGGFSLCGIGTDSSEGGTFHFTQYLNGEMVGEKSIEIEKEPFFSGSIRKKWQWMLAAIGFMVLTWYWIRRKVTGDNRSLKEVLSGESAATKAARGALVIGSHVGAGAQAAVPTPPLKVDEAQELRRIAQQFQALMAQADKSKGLELGRGYVGKLLKERNGAEAAAVFKACISADPAFRLAQADEVLPIAKAARAAGDSQAAVAAVRGFDKAFPGDPLIPEVYMFSAKLMAEDLRNPEMARKVLRHVLDKYPGHYIAQEAKRYLQAMPEPA